MKYFLSLIIIFQFFTGPVPVFGASSGVGGLASGVVEVLDAQNQDLSDVCAALTAQTGLTVTVSPELTGSVSLYIENASVEDVVKIIADAGGAAYLVTTTASGHSSFEIVPPEVYEQQTGRPFGQDKISQIFSLNNAKPGDIAKSLQTLKSSDGRVFAYDAKNTLIVMDRPEIVAEMLKRVKIMDVPTQMKTFEFVNISGHELLPQIQSQLTEFVGRAEVHQAAKRVTVTDTPEALLKIQQVIEAADHESRSVAIDAKVLQVVLSDEYVKGVDWAAIVSNYKNMKFSKKFDGDLAQNFSVGTVSNEDSQELQDSLDAVGIVQEVSRKTDVVRNGSSTGVDVKSIDLVLKPDNDSGVQRVEQRETIGFDLGVNIADDQHVSLSLVPQVSAYKERLWMDQFYTKSVARDFSSSKDKGAVELALGETLLVGGLFKNVTVESTRSIIPLLGKIPLLGFAFRNQGKEVRKAEMILFITPRLAQHE